MENEQLICKHILGKLKGCRTIDHLKAITDCLKTVLIDWLNENPLNINLHGGSGTTEDGSSFFVKMKIQGTQSDVFVVFNKVLDTLAEISQQEALTIEYDNTEHKLNPQNTIESLIQQIVNSR